jgi:hypothetical protein
MSTTNNILFSIQKTRVAARRFEYNVKINANLSTLFSAISSYNLDDSSDLENSIEYSDYESSSDEYTSVENYTYKMKDLRDEVTQDVILTFLNDYKNGDYNENGEERLTTNLDTIISNLDSKFEERHDEDNYKSKSKYADRYDDLIKNVRAVEPNKDDNEHWRWTWNFDKIYHTLPETLYVVIYHSYPDGCGCFDVEYPLMITDSSGEVDAGIAKLKSYFIENCRRYNCDHNKWGTMNYLTFKLEGHKLEGNKLEGNNEVIHYSQVK